jgi:RNA polymerase sigma factor (TIGR02999 family)
MPDLTQILNAIDAGDPIAVNQLLPLVYDELRQLASQKMAQEKPGQTLNATALVHEAYLRLIGPANAEGFANRKHFFAAAAEAMRRILVDNARRKAREKHGGQLRKHELTEPMMASPDDSILAIDEVLDRLAKEDPLAARIVEMRFFAQLSYEQIAELLSVTVYQVRQKWTYARAWLRDSLQSE